MFSLKDQIVELETNAKKLDWLINWPLVKNTQISSNQAHILATLPTHKLIILTKFHKDWQEKVDFFYYSEILSQSNFFCISLYLILQPCIKPVTTPLVKK